MRFRDRRHAGELLAEAVAQLGLEQPIVLGVPRGGVVVAAKVARRLRCPLDVVLVRKLRHPLQPELAIGAVGESGAVSLAPWARRSVPPEEIDAEIATQREAIRRRALLLRRGRPRTSVAGRDAVVVDDGAATGQTMALALDLLRTEGPTSLIAAVPVASPEALSLLKERADRVVYLQAPALFQAVGQFYERFSQVSDEEAAALLEASADGAASAEEQDG